MVLTRIRHNKQLNKVALLVRNGGSRHTALAAPPHKNIQVKQQVAECAVPPKTKTGQGLQYIINQEQLYLKVFLTDGDVPIDSSASERAIRTFCIGKKHWMFHNSANGASANANVYSISETDKLNNLRPYYYFKYILTELPKLSDEKGNIGPAKLDYLMPWSETLSEECRKPRRP